MSDQFDEEYAVWPERYYVIKKGRMAHIFYPKIEFGFDHNEMYSRLNYYAMKVQQKAEEEARRLEAQKLQPKVKPDEVQV